MLAWSVLNIPRFAILWFSFIKECRATALSLRNFRVYAINVHSLQVFTNIMTFSIAFFYNTASKWPGFNYYGVNMNFWVRLALLTVFMPWYVLCFIKLTLVYSSFWSVLPSKFSSMVAVAKIIWLILLAALTIVFIYYTNDSSNSLSASSSMSISTLSISSLNL